MNLETKLKAIQQLKSEKYVGTSEAWSYLDRVSALYENPPIIAREINNKLIDKIYYPATSEKIIGLCDFLSNILNDLKNYSNTENVVNEDEKFDKCPLVDFRSLIFGRNKNRNPMILSEYLYPIFNNLQIPDIRNIHFGIYSIKFILDETKSNQETRRFFLDKANVDWDFICSQKNLRDMEKESEGTIYLQEMGISKRIERIKRDLVSNKIENRREILTDFIKGSISDASKTLHNYDYIKELILKKLERRTNLIDRFKKINFAPQQAIDNQERLVKDSEFILDLIESDKNFIKKYLKS